MALDFDRVREVFFAVLELDPDARARALDEACEGDDALRIEVQTLLEHHRDDPLIRTTDHPAGGDDDVVPLPASSRYRELGELGMGGCGRVTRSYDRQLRRVVAHKRLRADRRELRSMLTQEARLLAYLDHPGTVQVFDADADGYTMRVLDGETLAARAAAGPLPLSEIIRIVSRVCETIANAHAKGVLHLDLKPANIVIQAFGQVSVIDWGLARFHDLQAYRNFLRDCGETDEPNGLGWEGVAGTPDYMPVEQAKGEPLTPAADVFALGTIVYELVTGTLPFGRIRGPLGVLAKSSAELTPLVRNRPDVPPRLSALCRQMLAPDPRDRPQRLPPVLDELRALSGSGAAQEYRSLRAGHVLFREGDEGQAAYHVVEGALTISVDGPEGPVVVGRRVPGQLVGESSVLHATRRTATVTAAEQTRVVVVTPAHLHAELDRTSPVLSQLVRALAERAQSEAESPTAAASTSAANHAPDDGRPPSATTPDPKLHVAWARDLERLQAEPDRIAARWSAAGDDAAARRWWLRAADEATTDGNTERAVEMLERALAEVPVAPVAERVQMQIKLAQQLRMLSRREDAFEPLDAAIADAEAAQLWLLASAAWTTRANLLTNLGSPSQSLRAHEQALAFARRAGSVDVEIQCLSNTADALAGMGRMTQSIAVWEEASAFAQARGLRGLVLRGGAMLANVWQVQLNFDAAEAALVRTEPDLGEATARDRFMWHQLRARNRIERGELDLAETSLAAAEALGRELGPILEMMLSAEQTRLHRLVGRDAAVIVDRYERYGGTPATAALATCCALRFVSDTELPRALARFEGAFAQRPEFANWAGTWALESLIERAQPAPLRRLCRVMSPHAERVGAPVLRMWLQAARAVEQALTDPSEASRTSLRDLQRLAVERGSHALETLLQQLLLA